VAELVAAAGDFLRQILDDTYPVWNDGLDRERYGRFWDAQLLTAWGSAHLDRVALLDDDAVVCSAKRYDLSARIDGRIRRVLGIGAVFTSPGRRGSGVATQLLESVLEAAEAEGYEYAMLFSEIGPAFYEKLDFVPIPVIESQLEVIRKGGTPAMLVRAGDDRDIPSIAEMSARRSEGARFALDRSEDWIRHGISKRRLLCGLGPPGLRELEFLVAEEGHQAVAYVISSVHRGHWFIEDAGDRDPAGARLGAMLQVMLARTPHLPPPQINAWLPHDFTPPQIRRVHTRPSTEVLMIRPLKDRSLPLPPLDGNHVTYWRLDYF
jgi:GNAT superfamily N-acetyltransferase